MTTAIPATDTGVSTVASPHLETTVPGWPATGRRRVRYASDRVHSSIRTAVELSGLGHANLRSIPTDDAFRLDVDALSAHVRSLRERPRRVQILEAVAAVVGIALLSS